MAVPRKEKAYEKYAWLIPFGIGLLAFAAGLRYVQNGFTDPLAPLNVVGLTGLSPAQFLARSPPGTADLVGFLVAFWSAWQATAGLFVMAISGISFRKGERWAWYALWLLMLANIGEWARYVAAGSIPLFQPIVGAIYALGLLLPIRKFFPKKQAVIP